MPAYAPMLSPTIMLKIMPAQFAKAHLQVFHDTDHVSAALQKSINTDFMYFTVLKHTNVV